MIFQREKALWRYASKNYAAATDGRTTNHPPPPQQRHPRLHPPPTVEAAAATGGTGWLATSTRPFAHCCRNTSDSSVADYQQQQAHHPPTIQPPPAHQAPPPYCSVSGGLDSSDMLCSTPHGYSVTSSYLQQPPPRLPQYTAAEAGESSSASAGDLDTDECELKSQGHRRLQQVAAAAAEARWTGSRTNGSNCESSGDDMLVDETDQMQRPTSNSHSNNNNHTTILDYPRMAGSTKSPPPHCPSDSQWSTTAHHGQQQQQQPATTTFVTSAANMFRNCCGRNCVDTSISSSSASSTTDNNNSHSKGVHPLLATAAYQNAADMKATTTAPAVSPPQYTPRQYFKALMKPLKSTQQTMLLKAVKSRLDHPACVRDQTATATTAATANAATSSSACILIPRMKILDEEPYVITCRLFLWPDLCGAAALKRLPLCPNERDPVYECCNPLHWCRILETDTAPPPYQKRTTMERLRREEIHSLPYPMANNNQTSSSVSVSSKNFSQNSISASYNSSSNWLQPGCRIASPESFTTNDEDCRSGQHSATWCQVAYWELAQRVGERHYAKKPSVNIYCDGPSSTIGDDMCLRDLVAKRSTAAPDDVQHTRRKIGLGVTLSREADGVWLYNRSSESIFVYSPTVNESWFRVCKVETGDCLKAFDSQRAQNLVYPMNLPSAQLGPVDVFSIRISFAKGWGSTYKRQDITRCPCWLEVIFNQR